MRPLFKNSLLQEEMDCRGFVVMPLLRESQIRGLRRLYDEFINQASISDLYESSRHNSLETNQQINQAICAEIEATLKDSFDACQFFGGTFMVKSHQDSTVLPLHQDWSVVEENEYGTAFIWCPLQDVDAFNGGIFVLKGSHKYFNGIRSGSYPSNRYILPYELHHCTTNIPLKAGEAIIYFDRLFHGSHSNQSTGDRIVVTGRVVEREARLVYFHKRNEDEVDVYPADPAFYLSHIDTLAKGRLPSGLSKLYTRAYRHEPVSDESLQSKIRENFRVGRQQTMECRLFKDEALQRAFDQHGYVVINLIEREQVDELHAFYRGLDHDPVPEYGFQVSLDNGRSDFVRAISEKLKQTAGPYVDHWFRNYQIFTASFVVKEKNPLGIVPPHQDWTFVDEQKYWSATIWCPLVDVDITNGGLGVIQGSHRFYDHIRPSPSPQYEPPFKHLVSSIFPYLKIIELKAGQALVFDNRSFHGSPPNTTEQSRIAFGLGITHEAARIQHFYLLPNSEKVLVERYEVQPEFFYTHNNARFSSMYEKGERPRDLNCSGLYKYTYKNYDAAQLVEMMEEAGNVRNEELFEKIKAFSPDDLAGTADKKPGAEEKNSHSENRISPGKNSPLMNIYNEIQNRVVNRSGEPLWKVYTPTRVVREIRYRLAKK
jgi:ectoine hydroxylase-related dioxygenase (phytanoyl-CoA dioxygenase family)